MSERPKCGSCVHWLRWGPTETPYEPQGICARFPPRLINPAVAPEENWSSWTQPMTTASASCSEHHNFPAYLAWFREQGATPKPPTAEPEYLSGDDLAKRIGRSKQTVQSWARLQKIGRVRGDRCWLYSVDDAIRYMARDPLRVAAMADKAEAIDPA